jgi:glyoxylase-like metal-dependent hydrolase (beta-lactamase superfamily II)
VVDGERSELLGGRYRFDRSDGHTPGMLHTTVQGAQRSVFFAADLIPGMPWVHVPITMGYDRFPERLIDEKTALLGRLVSERTRVFFTHDAEIAHAAVEQDDKGRFHAVDARRDAEGYTDLDASS